MTATIQPTKEIMSRREAAAYVGICLATLDCLGIPKTQIRRRVFYRKATLDRWVAEQERKGRKHEPRKS
jgi:hypothetical protein